MLERSGFSYSRPCFGALKPGDALQVYEQVLRCDWTPQELRQHFDPDGDGLVSLIEFKDGLKSAGLALPEWQINTLLRVGHPSDSQGGRTPDMQ
jgi:hypothetical protein